MNGKKSDVALKDIPMPKSLANMASHGFISLQNGKEIHKKVVNLKVGKKNTITEHLLGKGKSGHIYVAEAQLYKTTYNSVHIKLLGLCNSNKSKTKIVGYGVSFTQYDCPCGYLGKLLYKSPTLEELMKNEIILKFKQASIFDSFF